MRNENRSTSNEPVISMPPLRLDRRRDRAFTLGRLMAVLILTIIVILKLLKLYYP